MTPSPPPPARTGALLLQALESTGPRPALAWYGEAARIELSGHVLANWVIKAIGHLHDEVMLAPGEQVVLDLAPHWKRLVLALAAWSLGAEVTVLERGEDSAAPSAQALDAEGIRGVRVLVTDRPEAGDEVDAEEVLVLEAVSLAPRYPGELPALVRDWLVEVRGSSDRLGVALPAWSGPAPAELPDGAEVTHGSEDGLAAPRLLVEGDGLLAAPELLAALMAGGGIVAPLAQVSAQQAEAEGVTGRA